MPKLVAIAPTRGPHYMVHTTQLEYQHDKDRVVATVGVVVRYHHNTEHAAYTTYTLQRMSDYVLLTTEYPDGTKLTRPLTSMWKDAHTTPTRDALLILWDSLENTLTNRVRMDMQQYINDAIREQRNQHTTIYRPQELDADG